jgi:DNA polymerase (family 10)
MSFYRVANGLKPIPMNNQEVAKVFADIADRLELKKDNIFKIRAYRKVARSIEQLPVAVEELVREGRLKEIPGAGEAITKKITELITTGRLEYYEKLKAESPQE